VTENGTSTHAIQEQGRWKSPAMPALYTRGETAAAAGNYILG